MLLYDHPKSGNGYKVRLFLSLIGQPCQLAFLDMNAREHKSGWFLQLNPRGQVPVLLDGETVLFDSQAIVFYLAKKYAPHWLGADMADKARVVQWLSFCAKELANGLQALRLYRLLGADVDPVKTADIALASLAVLEDRLARDRWLCGSTTTIADICCFAYVHLAPDAGLQTDELTNVTRWLEQIRALPGFVEFGQFAHLQPVSPTPHPTEIRK